MNTHVAIRIFMKLIAAVVVTIVWQLYLHLHMRSPHQWCKGQCVASKPVNRRFETWSGQTKDYIIDICCFLTKHAALKSNNKDWLAWKQDKMSEWNDMSTHKLLFQIASTIKKKTTQLILLVKCTADIVLSKCNLFSP